MSRFKLVAWDMNGTLFNDVDLQYEFARHVFRRAGVSPPSRKEYFETMFATSFTEVYYTHGVPRTCTWAMLDRMRRDFFERHWTPGVLRPEAREVFAHCTQENVSQILITGELGHLVWQQLKDLRITDVFEYVWTDCGDKGVALQNALDRFSFLPEEVLFIDDVAECIIDAKSIGVYTLGMASGFTKEADIIASNPDYVIHSLTEVLEILKDIQ